MFMVVDQCCHRIDKRTLFNTNITGLLLVAGISGPVAGQQEQAVRSFIQSKPSPCDEILPALFSRIVFSQLSVRDILFTPSEYYREFSAKHQPVLRIQRANRKIFQRSEVLKLLPAISILIHQR